MNLLKHGMSALVLALASTGATAIELGTHVTDFSSGADGWTGRPGPPLTGTTWVDEDAGLEAPALHSIYNDFFRVGLRLSTENDAFVGDYTRFGTVTISLDINAIQIASGGQSVSKDLYLNLLDYDHPADGFDASIVSVKLGTLEPGAGWQHLSVTIPIGGYIGLPPGWSALTASGDSTLAADLTFQQLLAGVDQIALKTIGTPAAPRFDYEVLLDNVSIQAVAVPEPTSAALLAVGVLIVAGNIGGSRRRADALRQ